MTYVGRRATGVAVAAACLVISMPGGTLRAQASRPTQPGVAGAPVVRVRRAWPVMGTMLVESIWTRDTATAARWLLDARDSVRLVDSLMSTYRPGSELSRVNRAAGAGAVVVSPQTLDVLRKATLYWRLSAGAFDPTVGPLVRAWGFEGPAPRERPSVHALDSLRGLVGYGDVEIDTVSSAVRLPRAGMRLDLGGIAKGYALDLARRALTSPAIMAGSVDLGGNILMFGHPPADGRWRVRIADPLEPSRSIGTLTLDSGAVATSGAYEHNRVVNGRRYGHLISPRTGAPAHGVLSASAAGPLGEWSDGLSATLYFAGPLRGAAIADSLPNVAGIWVVDRGQRTLRASDVRCSARAARAFSLSARLPGRPDQSCVRAGDRR